MDTSPGVADRRDNPDVVHPLLLDRDLLAGETLVQFAALPTPLVAGRYALGIRVVQKDGPALGEPPSRMLRRVLDVQPRGPAAADVPAMSADRDFW